MKRLVLFVIAFLLPVLAAQASVASDQRTDLSEPVNIEEATINVTGRPFYYCGEAIEPEITVKLGECTLEEGRDYRVSYSNNVNVGKAEIKVEGSEGRYTGSKTHKFSIMQKQIAMEDLQITCSKVYDGTEEASPVVTIPDLPPESQVNVKVGSAKYKTPYVGEGLSVTLSEMTLEGNDAINYELTSDTMEIHTGEIQPSRPKIDESEEVLAGENTLDLMDLVEAPKKGQFVFEIAGDGLGSTISGKTFTSGSQAGQVAVTARLEEGYDENGDNIPEYTTDSCTITLHVTKRTTQVQPPLKIVSDQSVTYGETLVLKTEGGAGTGKVRYTVQPGTGSAAVDANGVLTPVQAGTVYVRAEKDGDETYQAAESARVTITIQKAELTVTAKHKTALVGEEVPALTAQDYTVTGLVGDDQLKTAPTLAYASPPDMTKPGEVAIHVSGAVVPDGGNYREEIRYVAGKLTIAAQPMYPITVEKGDKGLVFTSQETGRPGTKILLTAVADDGYVLERLVVRDKEGKELALTEQGNGVYAFVMPDGPVKVTGIFEEREEDPPLPVFSDVQEKDWFCEAVTYVSSQGLMNGMEGTLFGPHAPMTRGMLVTVLYRMAGSPAAPVGMPFQDVDPDRYYAKPVAWAAWYGIVNGYEGNRFLPDRAVTREELAVIFYRYAQYRQYDTGQRGDLRVFADHQKVQTYSWEALSWACGAGLMNGMDGNQIAPQGLAVRAQVAAILQRFCEGVEG